METFIQTLLHQGVKPHDRQQFDTGGVGTALVGLGDKISNEDAVLWYGIIAGIQPMVALILFLALYNAVSEWKNLQFVTYAAQGIWWPTFFAWLCASFFDSKQVRGIFGQAVNISLAGPFLLYWVGWADILMTATINKNWGLLTIVFIVVIFAWNIGSMVYCLIFVPKVLDWVESAAILTDTGSSDFADNIAGNDESNTLLASF